MRVTDRAQARRTAPGPIGLLTCLRRERTLVWELTKREVQARYRGSVFGLLWAFLNPLFLLLVFTFVFGTVFRAKWQRPVENQGEFALVLFAGLIVFWILNDCLTSAPFLVRRNSNYVKNVVFPLEILPCILINGALFHAAVSLLILLGAQLLVIGPPPVTVLLAPLVLLPFALLTLGLSWLLASLGVYLPDLGQLTGVGLTALLFLSTVFFPADAAPEALAPFLYLNPVSFIVDTFRGVVLWGEWPNWRGLALYMAGAWLVAWLGFWWFQRSRKGFADVL